MIGRIGCMVYQHVSVRQHMSGPDEGMLVGITISMYLRPICYIDQSHACSAHTLGLWFCALCMCPPRPLTRIR